MADDLIEPFRPIADLLVAEIYFSGKEENELTKEIKSKLLNVPYTDCIIDNKKSSLSIAAARICSSLANCFEGKTKEIICPQLKE